MYPATAGYTYPAGGYTVGGAPLTTSFTYAAAPATYTTAEPTVATRGLISDGSGQLPPTSKLQ